MANNFKNINSYLGAPIEEEKDWEDKALEYASSALEKAEPVLKVLGYPGGLVRGAIAGGLEAATGRDDLVDIKDVLKGEAPSSTEVLEKLGVKEMGSLSDVLPELYSETGKGIALQKGGLFDPTTRGTLGFAADVVTDPLTYLAGAGIAAKGAEAASESKPMFQRLRNVLSDQRGSFDTSLKPKVTEVMPGMYSKAEQIILDKMGGKATPEQIMGILREAKPEEIEYLKIPEFLEGKNKVTQEEMLQHIRQNLPKIEKKILKTDPLRRQYDELDYEKEIMDNKITNSAEDIIDVVPDYTDEDVSNFREKVKNVNSPEYQEEKKRIFDKVLKGKTFNEYKAKLAAKNSLIEASSELEAKLENINSLAHKTKKQIFEKLYPNYMDMPKDERRLLKNQFDKKFQFSYFDSSIDQERILGFRYFPPEFDEYLPKNFKELVKEFNDANKGIREISSQITRMEGELPRYLPSDIAKLEKLEDASLIKERNNRRIDEILKENPSILFSTPPRYQNERALKSISQNYSESVYNLKPPYVLEDMYEATKNQKGLTEKGKKIYEDFAKKEEELYSKLFSENFTDTDKNKILNAIADLRDEKDKILESEVIKKFPGHFDDSFTLTHRRGNEFLDLEGRKHLLVQEVQSDIHQMGRNYGYENPKEIAQNKKTINELEKKYNELDGMRYVIKRKYEELDYTPSRTQDQIDELKKSYKTSIRSIMSEMNKIEEEMKSLENKPFNAPIKDWQDFQAKQMLIDAAKGDFDNISWTTGDDQARLHGKLFENIHEIVAVKNADGTYTLDPLNEKGNTLDEYSSLLGKKFKPESLGNIVGKEAAAEIIQNGKAVAKPGQNLKLNFDNTAIVYDKNLPKFFERFGKKFGIMPEKITLPEYRHSTMWTFKMTPEMRKEILKKGFPLFMLPFLNQPEEEQEKPKFNKIRKSLNSKPL
jgi:hypothetical protein